MKTTLFTFFLIISSNIIQAQTNVYQPYPLDNASWTVRTIDGNSGPPVIEAWETKSWSGDTIINGETYVKVFGDPNMIGVRQDIPNEKIYYIDDQDVEYDASFDQDVQVGDTVTISEAFLMLNLFPEISASGSSGGNVIIQTIDSVSVGASYRKRITMIGVDISVGFGEATYICGVHFSSATLSISNALSLDCFYVDGFQLLGNPQNPYCTAGIKEFSKQKVSVYPNPTDGHFFVEHDPSSELKEIYLLDIRGTRVAQFDGKTIENGFDISSFPSGVYILEMVFSNGRARTALFK